MRKNASSFIKTAAQSCIMFITIGRLLIVKTFLAFTLIGKSVKLGLLVTPAEIRWARLWCSSTGVSVRINEHSLWVCFEGAVVQAPPAFDEPLRTKRQAISAEPSVLDPSNLTDVMLTSYLKTKEWAKETHARTHTHQHTHAWTVVTFECICRSGELIQKAFMNNDFMKHLEHGQVMTQPPH